MQTTDYARPTEATSPPKRRKPGLLTAAAVFAIVVIAGAILAIVSLRGEPQPAAPVPQDVLVIGNVMTAANFGMAAHLEELAASADPPLNITTASVAFGNSSLEDHWNIGQALDLIREGTWEVVVLDELFKGGAEGFREYALKFHEEIENVGARTVLLMSWEFDRASDSELEMFYGEIIPAYENLAAELSVEVAPVGLAWKQAIEERPDLNLFAGSDRWSPSHQGTSLAAYVLYATIFDQSPAGFPYQPADVLADMDGLEWQVEEWLMTDDDVSFLQQVAWDTVVEYQAEAP